MFSVGGVIVVAYMIVSLVISLPMIIISTEVSLASEQGTIFGIYDSSWGGLGVVLLIFVLYWPVAAVLRSVLGAFVQTVWILTFLRLTQNGMDDEDTITPEIRELSEPV